MKTATAPANAFTVDLEDWFQGLEITPEHWSHFEARLHVGLERLLTLLDEAHVRATFFVLGSSAVRHPRLVRRIHAAGHELGTHGYSHEFVYRLGAQGFAADLQRSLEILQGITDAPISGHRAPFFSITRQSPWAFQVLHDHGIRYDSSVFPVRNYRYGMPGARRDIHRLSNGLIEFPISTLRLGRMNLPVAGGAYFRLFPYSFIRHALRHLNRQGWPAVFYIHPWELDPGHPRLALPRRIRFTHYHNLSCTAARLRRLLHDFRFASMEEVLAQQGWLPQPR